MLKVEREEITGIQITSSQVLSNPVHTGKIPRSQLLYFLLFNAWYVGRTTLAIFSGRTEAS
jgi:hypothetical protein